MGLSHTWIAVQGLDAARALEALDMEIAGLTEPDCLPRGRGIGELPGGWLLVISAKDEIGGELTRLAEFGPAVACEMRDMVMCSEARGYTDGEEIWRVARDCEQGTYALEVSGNPPPQLESIIHDTKAEQVAEGGEEADVDYMFDVPPKLALSICGFMLGEVEPESLRYSDLRKAGSGDAPAKHGGFFARLFGRG